MIALRHSILACLLLATGALFPAQAQQPLLSATYEELRGSTVTVTPVFGLAGSAGSLAVRVEIRNLTSAERTWVLSLTEGYPSRTLSTKADFSFRVPAGQVSSHDVLLPLTPHFINSAYRTFTTEVYTSGQKTERRDNSFDDNETLAIVALSEKLATRSLSALDQAWLRGSSDKRFGLSYDPKNLPSDWRGYSALDVLLIDLPTWKTLPRETVRSILTWVRLGGVLDIYVDNTNPSSLVEKTGPTLADVELKIPDPYDAKETRLDLSLGTIRVFPWNGSELSNKITSNYNHLTSRNDTLTQGSGLEKEIGTPEVQGGLAFAILLVFAIIVGPFNLFFLAKKGRRHRLFVTTPIISFAACVMVVLLIVFREGIGGNGYRATFAELTHDSEGSRLLLTQSQVSRTGVMFGSGFGSDLPLQIDPVEMSATYFNPLSNIAGLHTTYLFRENRHEGGFFRSRSEQGFSVRAALPTRSRIELTSAPVPTTNGDVFSTPPAPTLVSSLGLTITELYFRDQSGAVWHSDTPTPPGGTFQLVPSTHEKLHSWLQAQGTSLPEKVRDDVRHIGMQNGRYVARAAYAPELILPTHPDIRWQTTPTLLTGLPVQRSGPPSATTPAPAAPAP